jgi:hypothetical protein
MVLSRDAIRFKLILGRLVTHFARIAGIALHGRLPPAALWPSLAKIDNAVRNLRQQCQRPLHDIELIVFIEWLATGMPERIVDEAGARRSASTISSALAIVTVAMPLASR